MRKKCSRIFYKILTETNERLEMLKAEGSYFGRILKNPPLSGGFTYAPA